MTLTATPVRSGSVNRSADSPHAQHTPWLSPAPASTRPSPRPCRPPRRLVRSSAALERHPASTMPLNGKTASFGIYAYSPRDVFFCFVRSKLGGQAFLDAKLEPGCVAAIVWRISTRDYGFAAHIAAQRRAVLGPRWLPLHVTTGVESPLLCLEVEPQHVLARSWSCDHAAVPQHQPEEVGDRSGPSHPAC